MPRVLEAHQNERFDKEIMNGSGELLLLDSTLAKKHGCTSVTITALLEKLNLVIAVTLSPRRTERFSQIPYLRVWY